MSPQTYNLLHITLTRQVKYRKIMANLQHCALGPMLKNFFVVIYRNIYVN
jgi:hypothetical protein